MQGKSSLYILVGLLIWGFLDFPLEMAGIVLEIMGLSLIRNRQVFFKAAWVLGLFYGAVYGWWVLTDRLGLALANGIVQYGWVINEGMMAALMVGVMRYYQEAVLSKAARAGLVLVGARAIIYLTKGVWSGYVFAYPLLHMAINGMMLVYVLAVSRVLWLCYKKETAADPRLERREV